MSWESCCQFFFRARLHVCVYSSYISTIVSTYHAHNAIWKYLCFRYLISLASRPLLDLISALAPRVVIEHMQVPVLVNICPVSLKKVLAYVQLYPSTIV